jgi:imidazoleglycerol phosphate synthase glutamine amidotransferase subunit HisH
MSKSIEMVKQAVTSDSWNGTEWIQVVSMVDVPAMGWDALQAIADEEYLATCTEEEAAEYMAFKAL